MYVDALGRVSNAQAVTATAVSTDKIDLGASTVRRQIGEGEAMGFGVSVGVAAVADDGDETYQFDIVSDEDAALGSPTVHASFVIARGLLTAGSLHWLPIPRGGPPMERYLGLRYTTGGTTPGITVTAWLTSHQLFSINARPYAKGYTIS